jgi:hypothetical protein
MYSFSDHTEEKRKNKQKCFFKKEKRSFAPTIRKKMVSFKRPLEVKEEAQDRDSQHGMPSPHKILAVLAAFPLTFAYTACVVVSSSCPLSSIAHFFALAAPALPCIYGMHCIMVCYNIACCFVGIELGYYLYRGPLILSSRSCSRYVLNSFCVALFFIVPFNAISSCNLLYV